MVHRLTWIRRLVASLPCKPGDLRIWMLRHRSRISFPGRGRRLRRKTGCSSDLGWGRLWTGHKHQMNVSVEQDLTGYLTWLHSFSNIVTFSHMAKQVTGKNCSLNFLASLLFEVLYSQVLVQYHTFKFFNIFQIPKHIKLQKLPLDPQSN